MDKALIQMDNVIFIKCPSVLMLYPSLLMKY